MLTIKVDVTTKDRPAYFPEENADRHGGRLVVVLPNRIVAIPFSPVYVELGIAREFGEG